MHFVSGIARADGSGCADMVQSENNSPPKSALPAWLIFGVLGVAATLCGLVLPQSLRSLREPTAAVPAPEPAPETKEAPGYEPPTLPEMPPAGPMLLRLTLGTIFVLILCVFTLWVGKRWVRPLAAPVGENRKLRVLESLPLGGRCSVFLLQAEESKILVGVDQAGIKALVPLSPPFENALKEMTGADD